MLVGECKWISYTEVNCSEVRTLQQIPFYDIVQQHPTSELKMRGMNEDESESNIKQFYVSYKYQSMYFVIVLSFEMTALSETTK